MIYVIATTQVKPGNIAAYIEGHKKCIAETLKEKGCVSYEGHTSTLDPDRYVVQGVHMIIEGDHQRAWKPEEKRESRLVFIGRELDPAELKAGFENCQVK